MLEAKIILTLLMIYIAVVIASVLKLEQITPKNFIVSMFMPMILILSLIRFSRYVWNTELKEATLKEKVIRLLKLLVFEIQCLPQIHTIVISTFKESVAEKNDMSLIFKMPSDKLSLQRMRSKLTPYLRLD